MVAPRRVGKRMLPELEATMRGKSQTHGTNNVGGGPPVGTVRTECLLQRMTIDQEKYPTVIGTM